VIKSIGFASAWILPVTLANLLPLGWLNGISSSSTPPAPLKALFLTGGGSADYKTLAPFLTNSLSERINVTFDVDFTLDRLTNESFASGYDVVVYDMGFDDANPAAVGHALAAIRNGKPALMIQGAVQAFANTKTVAADWEKAAGMKSAGHDEFESFQTQRMDTNSPILNSWPDDWRTGGDELYHTSGFLGNSHPLLCATSPADGRAHIVCWTQIYGKGRVFATTLGHDMTTTRDPAYLGLLARGLLWSCNKLEPDGKAADGYGKEYNADK